MRLLDAMCHADGSISPSISMDDFLLGHPAARRPFGSRRALGRWPSR